MSDKSNFKQRRKGTYGLVHASSLMGQHTKRASGTRGFSKLRLLTHWEEVVGPTLASITRPAKVSFAKEGFGATLTIFASGAHAPEIQLQLNDIRARVNACYGYNAIARVRITQTDKAGLGFSEEQAAFEHDANQPELSDEQVNSLGLDNVSDEGLRDALMALSKSVLTRQN